MREIEEQLFSLLEKKDGYSRVPIQNIWRALDVVKDEAVDWKVRDFRGMSFLHRAVKSEDFVLVAAVLDKAPQLLNSLSSCLETPLMMACSLGNTDIANFLIDQGADTRRADVHGETAFDHARTAWSDHLNSGIGGYYKRKFNDQETDAHWQLMQRLKKLSGGNKKNTPRMPKM